MDAITAEQSVYVNGRWMDATWMVETLDGETGEMVITATVDGPGAPVVCALRMSMELASQLRVAAGFVGVVEAETCYDCRTTTERLEALERRVEADADALAVQYAGVLEALRAPRVTRVQLTQGVEMSDLRVRLTALEARMDGMSALGEEAVKELARQIVVDEWSDEIVEHWRRLETLTGGLVTLDERLDTLAGVVRLTQANEIAELRRRLALVALAGGDDDA